MNTNSTPNTKNPTTTQSIQDLQSQRTILENKANELERKANFWHTAVLVTAFLTAAIGLLAFIFQRLETQRTNVLNETRKSISSVTEQIHKMEIELEASARRGMEKRTLSQEQFRTISETLRSFPIRTAQVSCPFGNQEAYGFAKQISRVLEAANWRTSSTMQVDNAPQNTGVTLFVREADFEGAEQLRDAFQKAGIWSAINVRNPLPGVIKVYIGAKP